MNFKNIVLTLLSGCLAGSSFAKSDNPALAASAIPATLKTNAHAVIRYSNTELNIESVDRMQYKHKYAITILDEQGKSMAAINEHYNLLVKINNIEASLYDADGKEVRSLKEKDIYDRSTYGLTGTFHSDERIKVYSFEHTVYPYTVAVEIDETIKTTFFLPSWNAQPDNECAVEQAELQPELCSGTAHPVQRAVYPRRQQEGKQGCTGPPAHELGAEKCCCLQGTTIIHGR